MKCNNLWSKKGLEHTSIKFIDQASDSLIKDDQKQSNFQVEIW